MAGSLIHVYYIVQLSNIAWKYLSLGYIKTDIFEIENLITFCILFISDLATNRSVLYPQIVCKNLRYTDCLCSYIKHKLHWFQ